MTQKEEEKVSEPDSGEFFDLDVCPWCYDLVCLVFGICRMTGRSPYFVPFGDD